MPRMTFRLKTVLGIALIEAAALLFLIWTSLSLLQSSNEKELSKRAYTTASVFAATTRDAVIATDLSSLDSFISNVLENPDIVYARIRNNDTILSEGGLGSALHRPYIADIDASAVDDGIFDAHADIKVKNTNYGRVELGISTGSFQELLASARNKTIFIAIIEMSLVALFSLFLGSYLTKSLVSLMEGARKLAQGEVGYQIKVTGSRDEFADTVLAFNDMSQRLQQSIIDRHKAETTLHRLNEELEKRVETRTQELATANRELEYRALHDTLTKLPNRGLFFDRLQQAILAGKRNNQKHALIIIDLDRFKAANDMLGHHYGDSVLQEVANRLRSTLRASDTVARLGGDEFALLLWCSTGRSEVEQIGKRIREVIERPISIDDQKVEIGLSLGVAMFPEDGDEINTLMQHADIAMYEAKQNKTGLVFFNSTLGDKHQHRLYLQNDLRRAIMEDELVLHYQPKIDFPTGTIVGVEALVRWQHPQQGLLFPDNFIVLAEQCGLIKQLTLKVLQKALTQAQEWHRLGLQLSVSINISVLNLQDLEFPAEVKAIICQYSVPTTFLEMEVTETAVMANPVCAMQIIAELTKLGITLSIDDFGTGYCSMSYLQKLVLAKIKIDKSFVMDMNSNQNNTAIVRSTIDLGHNLGLKVVAEGVEDEATWQQLKEFGCDNAQGYYISKPLPAAGFLQWLKTSPWSSAEIKERL